MAEMVCLSVSVSAKFLHVVIFVCCVSSQGREKNNIFSPFCGNHFKTLRVTMISVGVAFVFNRVDFRTHSAESSRQDRNLFVDR